MGLTADVSLRGVVLGVQRVEVLLQPMIGRDPGIDRTANGFDCCALHGRCSDGGLSRPKNLGPDQRVPVMAKATLDRLRYVFPFQENPSAITVPRSGWPSHSRRTRV